MDMNNQNQNQEYGQENQSHSTDYYNTNNNVNSGMPVYGGGYNSGNNGRHSNKGLIIVIVILCMIIAGGAGAAFTYFATAGKNNATVAESSSRVVEEKKEPAAKIGQTEVISGLSAAGTSDLSEVYDAVLPSIVAITCQSTEDVQTFFGTYSKDITGAGSGVIFDEDDKNIYILTNNHVVDGAKSIVIKFSDDEAVEGEVQGTAAYSDLAVVKVKLSDMRDSTKKAIKLAELGDSDSLKVGEMVMAIGNALGYGQSLTVGYVSATSREVNMDDITLELIQTDAAINPGNSGGALINLRGQVIGINSAKLADRSVEGMGYAIPMNTAKPLAEKLKTSEAVDEKDRGYLGVYYAVVNDETHSVYNIPYGLYVSEVAEDGGAAAAGIQKGDVITKIDGYKIKNSVTINSILSTKKKGDKVKVTIQRYDNGEYKETDIEVTLAKKPAEKESDVVNQGNSGENDGDYPEDNDNDEEDDLDNYNNFFFGW